MSWIQHWNDAGVGEGHSTFIRCGKACESFPHERITERPPVLSWEGGFDPKDWICDRCGEAR